MSEEPRGIEFLTRAWKALGAGDVSLALRHVGEAYGYIGRWCDGVQRLPIGWPEADRVIAAAADRVRIDAGTRGAATPVDRGDAILLSRWTNYGGHRFAATDILSASPARAKSAFVINPGNPAAPVEKIASRLGIPESAVEIVPEGNRDRPWEWLPARIDARGCSRLFIVHETYRPGALVAALASSCQGIYLLHHIDSKPCSGLYLAGIRVIECTPFCFYYSRRHLGIDPIYLPLVSEAPVGERPPFMPDGQLRTATCGREDKFATERGFPYAGTIAERLRRFPGVHMHMGNLSERARDHIAAEMRRSGVETGRFIYLSRVPNLPTALWEHGVDVYLASFPVGGARTIVDVMASGTPMIAHIKGAHERCFGVALRAPGTELWSRPEELWAVLDAVKPEWLGARSRMAREHFEKHHSRDVLQKALGPAEIRGVLPAESGDGVIMPSPQNALCQMIADVAWLRKQNGEMGARLDQLERMVSRAVKWPSWITRQ